MVMRILFIFIVLARCSHCLSFDQAAEEIVSVGQFLNQMGLCPATSGNISIRLDEGLAAVTVSGKHKGELTADDVMRVDLQGKAYHTNKKPSAETLLHTLLYTLFDDVNAVIHTHSLSGTVLSRRVAPASAIATEGYEIHKAFRGITTHESTLIFPIFENSQDLPALAAEIGQYLEEHPSIYGFLLRGHGFYVWGKDMKEAKIRAEALEYLLECELRS